MGSRDRWYPSGVKRYCRSWCASWSTICKAFTSSKWLQASTMLVSKGGSGVLLRKLIGETPLGKLDGNVSCFRLVSSRRCSYSKHNWRISSSNGVRSISGDVCRGMDWTKNSSEYSRQHTPAVVRPARPARCLADAWLVQTVTSSLILVEALNRLSLTRPVSITWETSVASWNDEIG